MLDLAEPDADVDELASMREQLVRVGSSRLIVPASSARSVLAIATAPSRRRGAATLVAHAVTISSITWDSGLVSTGTVSGRFNAATTVCAAAQGPVAAGARAW